ncbi:MAG: hypothetical protein AAFN92_14995, partial [Bacteroidota bacterium]
MILILCGCGANANRGANEQANIVLPFFEDQSEADHGHREYREAIAPREKKRPFIWVHLEDREAIIRQLDEVPTKRAFYRAFLQCLAPDEGAFLLPRGDGFSI